MLEPTLRCLISSLRLGWTNGIMFSGGGGSSSGVQLAADNRHPRIHACVDTGADVNG
jgi:hypothetical protein